MGLWGGIKGVAKRLLPFVIQGGLEQYRKKNPKSGWIVDAVESSLESNEQEMGFRSLTPEKKVERVAKQVRSEFPDIDIDKAREIARLAVISKTDKKGA